jgi:hypothetical protein
MGSNPLSAYVPGIKAWFTDKDAGWVSATLLKPVSISEKGEVSLSFTMDDNGAPRQVTTTLEKIEQQKGNSGEEALPPLRNPPLLESTDDLTNLSYLNEPAGMLMDRSLLACCCRLLITLGPRNPYSASCYSKSIFAETHLHLFRYSLDCSQSFLRTQSLLSRNYTSILWQAKGRAGAALVCNCRRCVQVYDQG